MVQRRDLPMGEKQYDVEHMRSRRDIDGLTEALQTGDPDVRRNAALALGALGEWRAVDPLIRALADPAQDVRESAANALVMVGTPAVDPLVDLLEQPDIAKVYGVPREAPGEGLTQVDLLAGPEGVPIAERTLQHEGGLTQHDLFGGPEDVRAKKTLQHRGLAQHDLLAGPEGVKEHEALFPEARRAGVTREDVPPGMKPGLRRAYAAVILGEIADPRVEEPLTRALSDSDPAVRRSAEDGMARFRAKRGAATSVPPASR